MNGDRGDELREWINGSIIHGYQYRRNRDLQLTLSRICKICSRLLKKYSPGSGIERAVFEMTPSPYPQPSPYLPTYTPSEVLETIHVRSRSSARRKERARALCSSPAVATSAITISTTTPNSRHLTVPRPRRKARTCSRAGGALLMEAP